MLKSTYTSMSKRKPLVKAISEERILQLSNDLSEDIRSGTVEEWRAVALYFRKELDASVNRLNQVRPSIAALVSAHKLNQYAMTELSTWTEKLAQHESNSSSP